MVFHLDVKRQLEIQKPLLEISREKRSKSLNTDELIPEYQKSQTNQVTVPYWLCFPYNTQQPQAGALNLELDPFPSISPQTSW